MDEPAVLRAKPRGFPHGKKEMQVINRKLWLRTGPGQIKWFYESCN